VYICLLSRKYSVFTIPHTHPVLAGISLPIILISSVHIVTGVAVQTKANALLAVIVPSLNIRKEGSKSCEYLNKKAITYIINY